MCIRDSVVGEFETNEDYMPYWRSLTENTVKGYVHVPVDGAGTANSEFEDVYKRQGQYCWWMPVKSSGVC